MKLKLLKGTKTILEKDHVPYTFKYNILTFQIENMEHTLNLETQEFTRENEEYAFFLNILDENCEITLKKEQYYLQVLVEYANLLKNKNILELSYYIETEDSEIKLIIELEGEKI